MIHLDPPSLKPTIKFFILPIPSLKSYCFQQLNHFKIKFWICQLSSNWTKSIYVLFIKGLSFSKSNNR